ncbi:MAG: hypothetical protein PHC38_02440 [Weeksellaceae bacterium]|nr:hypothetical protein [Weeksellaceae bacterium]
MDIKNIKTLADLRKAKEELRIEMNLADKKLKNGFIYSSVNKFAENVESNATQFDSPLGNGVHATLGFISNKAGEQFKLKKSTRKFLQLAVLIATPIITKKIQELIDKKI